jgi:hypothetical protein
VSPGGAVVLFGDEDDYWRAYVRSLGPAHRLVPALAVDPGRTAAVLTDAGVPIAATLPGADDDRLAAELAALTCDGDLDRVDRLEQRLRQRQPAWSIAAAWVVGVGPAAALGLARAVADGRRFLAVESLDSDRLDDVCCTAGSLHVVAGDLDPDAMARLGRRLAATATAELLPGVPGIRLGYLTGRDRPAMTVLDAKQRLGSRGDTHDVLVDSTLGAPADADAGLTLVPYQAVGRGTLRGDIRLLAMTSHGMSDLLHLNDDYVCGRSRYLDLGKADPNRLPSCTMAEDAYCFFKRDGTPLTADALPAEHVLVNSCGSLVVGGGDFGLQFSIWSSALDGRSRSFVGATRWKDGHGLEGHLYRRLLLAGHPLGTAVALLNRALSGHQLESVEVYVLIGDPEERLVEPQPPTSVPVLTAGVNRVAVRAGFARLELDPALADAAATGTLLIEAPGLVASTVPPAVLLSGPADVTGEVDVRVRDLAPELHRARDAAAALRESLDPVLGLQALYPDKVRQGIRKNLEARLVHVARLWKEQATDPTVVPRLLRSLRNLERELGEADAEIAHWMHERIRSSSYRFSEHYQQAFTLAPARPAGDCPLCGGELTARTMAHVLRPEVSRTEFICRRCGGIEDTPDPSLSIRVEMAATNPRGNRAEVSLRLRNDADSDRTGWCLVAVRRSADLPIGHPTPALPVAVDAGSTTAVPFVLDIGPAVPVHQYDLQAAYIGGTRIHLGRRPFWVTNR